MAESYEGLTFETMSDRARIAVRCAGKKAYGMGYATLPVSAVLFGIAQGNGMGSRMLDRLGIDRGDYVEMMNDVLKKNARKMSPLTNGKAVEYGGTAKRLIYSAQQIRSELSLPNTGTECLLLAFYKNPDRYTSSERLLAHAKKFPYETVKKAYVELINDKAVVKTLCADFIGTEPPPDPVAVATPPKDEWVPVLLRVDSRCGLPLPVTKSAISGCGTVFRGEIRRSQLPIDGPSVCVRFVDYKEQIKGAFAGLRLEPEIVIDRTYLTWVTPTETPPSPPPARMTGSIKLTARDVETLYATVTRAAGRGQPAVTEINDYFDCAGNDPGMIRLAGVRQTKPISLDDIQAARVKLADAIQQNKEFYDHS